MGFVDHISFPATPEGKVVKNYLVYQHIKDFSKGNELFTDDVYFNGLLFQGRGREMLVPGFQDFVNTMLTSLRIEAVNPVGDDKFMALYFSKMKGSDQQVPICDLLTMRDGKICRVDNCFDVSKTSKEVQDYSKEASNA